MFRNLEELYRYRALIGALVGRHLRARYRGSVLGFVWSFLNPLCLIAVYTLVFRSYIHFETGEAYPLFLLTGLLPWIWFSSGILEATASISAGGNLITKAMFPPQILPTVAVLTHLANFLFALPVLVVFLFAFGKMPSAALAALPLIVALQLILMLGLSYLFSALNVFFRDIQHILGNIFTLMFFLTPVIYPLSTVPEKHRVLLLAVNPLAFLMEMYRGAVLEQKFPGLLPAVWIAALGFLAFWVGNAVFNRYRESFAEGHMKIHQFVHTLAFGDAISSEALTIQRILAAAGIPGEIVVVHRDERFERQTIRYQDFQPEAGSTLLLHYSIASPLNDLFLGSAGVKRAVIYHNLTPDSWFLPYNARVVADLRRARDGLKAVVECADLVLADSTFNLEELSAYRVRDARVFPLTLDTAKWAIPTNAGIKSILKGHGGVNILTVGRIAPNKCLEDILKCFYFYHQKVNPQSRLWIVGSDVDTEIYSFELREMIEHLRLREAVTMVGAVADSELKAFYENADLYMCMSEHEGFCVPLIEAMYFNVPILAFDCCAVGETLGKAGLLVRKKEHAKISELMNLILTEQAARDRMLHHNREELQRFSLDSFQEQLIRNLVEPLRALQPAELPTHAQSWA